MPRLEPDPTPGVGRDDRVRQGRRVVVTAGHRGDAATAAGFLTDPDPGLRSLAVGAVARCGGLTAQLVATLATDPAAGVRRRAVELAPDDAEATVVAALADPDATVAVAAAAWLGERRPGDDTLDQLEHLAHRGDDALAREAAVAALGAIGAPRSLPTVLAATTDKVNVRRRAVLALAPYHGDEVTQALERATTDRDRQVRQAASDLLGLDDSDADPPISADDP